MSSKEVVKKNKKWWIIAGLGIAVFVVIVVVISDNGTRFAFARYPHEIEFVGRQTPAGTDYFSLRIGNRRTGRPISPECPILLHYGASSCAVTEISPNVAREFGASIKASDYAGAGDAYGFVGGYDEQNRDFGIEFYFDDGRIIEFYARFHRESGCPFSFSLIGADTKVEFPLSQEDLEGFLGSPEMTHLRDAK